MTKQKKGFWLFLASLIPGAGEMYMGFLKKGISLMLIFCLIPALTAATGFDWVLFFIPLVWFYSFFDTHNLKSLSEEEFYSLEDDYVLHIGKFIGNADDAITKYQHYAAPILIIFGLCILLNNVTDIVSYLMPAYLSNTLRTFTYNLPQIIIAAAIILAGFYMMSNRKRGINRNSQNQEEHYWQPYRPYHQMPGNNYPDSRQPQNNQYQEFGRNPNNHFQGFRQNPNASSQEFGQTPNTDFQEFRQNPNTDFQGFRQNPNADSQEFRQAPNDSSTKPQQVPNDSFTKRQQVPNDSSTEVLQAPDSSSTKPQQAPNASASEVSQVPNDSTKETLQASDTVIPKVVPQGNEVSSEETAISPDTSAASAAPDMAS